MAGILAYSSRHSEEGFHSGSSQDDMLYVPPVMDRLTNEFGQWNIQQKRYAFGQQKCNSDSGASTGELDQVAMKEELGLRGGDVVKPKMPGSWFYEELYHRGDESSSPTSDSEELYLAQMLGAARNVSENVEVPSSEHVAEIVGRQGCKIKALRAKTNTYIKTPVRGEEPVFVVTGKPEDVMEAKKEIECAAEHFTQIRASRRHSQGGAPAPGHVTAYVRVPLRVVGLVVGPKGATIKRIQQDTHTYIITPSREREPIFEVTGLPQNVEAARREIEQHIYQRTGNMPITDPTASISNYAEFSQLQMAAAQANAASRQQQQQQQQGYGSLAPSAAGRMGGFPGAQTAFGRSTENYSFNHMNNMMQNYHKISMSPKFMAPSPTLWECSAPPALQAWSQNNYHGFGGISEEIGNNGRSSILNGASAWSSAFGVGGKQDNTRDEGLGDSPSSGNENPYRLMSSIWADLEQPRDENSHAVLTA